MRRLRREAARTGETTASGAGDDGVMYGGKAAAGCDLTILFVCLRVRVGRRVASPPETFSKRTKCVVCLGPKLVTASCALYLIHNVIIIITVVWYAGVSHLTPVLLLGGV